MESENEGEMSGDGNGDERLKRTEHREKSKRGCCFVRVSQPVSFKRELGPDPVDPVRPNHVFF